MIRFRAKREHLGLYGLLIESKGQNLALTALCVPYSLQGSRRTVMTKLRKRSEAIMELMKCRANMAHVRKSRPDPGLDFQVKYHP